MEKRIPMSPSPGCQQPISDHEVEARTVYESFSGITIRYALHRYAFNHTFVSSLEARPVTRSNQLSRKYGNDVHAHSCGWLEMGWEYFGNGAESRGDQESDTMKFAILMGEKAG